MYALCPGDCKEIKTLYVADKSTLPYLWLCATCRNKYNEAKKNPNIPECTIGDKTDSVHVQTTGETLPLLDNKPTKRKRERVQKYIPHAAPLLPFKKWTT